jgi:hypothetical protein
VIFRLARVALEASYRLQQDQERLTQVIDLVESSTARVCVTVSESLCVYVYVYVSVSVYVYVCLCVCVCVGVCLCL